MKKNIKSISLLVYLLIPLGIVAQETPIINKKIKGKIISSNTNRSLSGATININGTTNNSTSDLNGEFSLITGQKIPFTVTVTYVGYQKKEIAITDSLITIKLDENVNELGTIIVSSRRRQESIQEVPIPISVISGVSADEKGAFNTNRIKELIPSVQLYASNPRNTTLNIRGMGSTFGLTNDGIDPGVGFYVDGVYYARPAASSLDFVDIAQIEVLRGPQGTLFGKNTTAGAFNITTKAASFTPGLSLETSYGNLNYMQAKASITGPLSKKLAFRASFSGTQRDGTLYNTHTQKPTNTLNNLGFRAQLLYKVADALNITFAGDYSRQRPDGYATVVAGVVTTKRPAYRQFNQIIADLGYQLPTNNPFDRITDTDVPWKANNSFGGFSMTLDTKIGKGKLTSISAWRFWDWDPSNDRDFIGLPVLSKSQGNSKHQQLTQEIRYAGNFSSKLSGLMGVFFIGQDLKSAPYQIEESGAAQWRFAKNTASKLWETPGLFDGFGTKTNSNIKSLGAAIFGQLDWAISKKLHVLPGIRFNYDQKDASYDRQTYGGLQSSDPELIALKNSLYSNQSFHINAAQNNFSGQITFAYKAQKNINAFVTYANSYKPLGINLGGLPSANGVILIDLAKVKPEFVTHFEIGIKTNTTSQSTLNLVLFNTAIKDYQTQVQTAELGVNRGYLANAEKVRVNGVELDGNIKLNNQLSITGALSYTDGKYVKFTNAPVPLEEVGASVAFKDVSGGPLPGISKWSGSLGTEYVKEARFISLKGNFFIAADSFFRSSFSSSPSPSLYLNIKGYTLLNSRIGFRAKNGFAVFLWARNLANKNYFEQLLPAAGSAGQYAAVLGDPRTYGVTLKYAF